MITAKRDAIIGIIDQGLISASNLGIGLLLINFTSKDNYGLYGIGFAAILYSIGLANSLITTQMMIFTAEKESIKKLSYCYSMLLAQYCIFLPAWFVFEILILIFYYFDLISITLLLYLTVIASSILTTIFQEFMRQYFFQSLQPRQVLKIDIINVALIISGLIMAIFYKLDMLHIWTVGAIGISSFIAGITGLYLSQLPQKITIAHVKEALSEAWLNGRWGIGATIVMFFQSQGYIALLSVLASPASIAEANAARLFLAPVGMISTSLQQVFLPRLVLLKNDNEHEKVLKLALKILLMVICIICLVLFFVYLAKELIITHLFSKEYSNISPLIYLWAFVFLMQSIRSNAYILLQTYKKFKTIAVFCSATAVLTMILGYVLIKSSGVTGSILAIGLSELSLALLLWSAFYAYKFSRNN